MRFYDSILSIPSMFPSLMILKLMILASLYYKILVICLIVTKIGFSFKSNNTIIFRKCGKLANEYNHYVDLLYIIIHVFCLSAFKVLVIIDKT